jgi:hypothetical protein
VEKKLPNVKHHAQYSYTDAIQSSILIEGTPPLWKEDWEELDSERIGQDGVLKAAESGKTSLQMV